jgi:hypothetical protein
MKSACPTEALGREYAQLWRAFNLAEEGRDSPFVIDAIVERRDHLEVQATYLPAASLNGALFQLGQATLWLGCVDGERKVERLIASVAKMLISMGGQVNEWCDPTVTCDDRVQAVIVDLEPVAA